MAPGSSATPVASATEPAVTTTPDMPALGTGSHDDGTADEAIVEKSAP